MRLGILGAADIAFRRFLPALQKLPEIEYAGVASRTPEKGKPFEERFGAVVYPSYDELIADERVDAIYVPLPPALHAQWGKAVLHAGKHLLMEKPFTTKLTDTEELLMLAREKGLVVHENYMFVYHSQITRIKEMIAGGELGEIRLFRMAFGFPKRSSNDFRYVRSLGGGALLDCGGYPVRLALELLGDSARIVQTKLTQPEGYEVDLFGNAVLENDAGQCAQIAFGMDNAYQCQLEVWGSEKTVIAPRVFTASADFSPSLIIRTSSDEHTVQLEADDQFLHSIEAFAMACAVGAADSVEQIRRQGMLIEEIKKGIDK